MFATEDPKPMKLRGIRTAFRVPGTNASAPAERERAEMAEWQMAGLLLPCVRASQPRCAASFLSACFAAAAGDREVEPARASARFTA